MQENELAQANYLEFDESIRQTLNCKDPFSPDYGIIKFAEDIMSLSQSSVAMGRDDGDTRSSFSIPLSTGDTLSLKLISKHG